MKPSLNPFSETEIILIGLTVLADGFTGVRNHLDGAVNGGHPYAILDDVTVFGLSLPKAWLGGLKGENLIGQAMGERNGSPLFRGIKSLRVEPGALVLEVED